MDHSFHETKTIQGAVRQPHDMCQCQVAYYNLSSLNHQKVYSRFLVKVASTCGVQTGVEKKLFKIFFSERITKHTKHKLLNAQTKQFFFTYIDLSEVLKVGMSITAQHGDSVPSAHSFAGNEIGPLSHCRHRRQTLQLILIQRGRAEQVNLSHIVAARKLSAEIPSALFASILGEIISFCIQSYQ